MTSIKPGIRGSNKRDPTDALPGSLATWMKPSVLALVSGVLVSALFIPADSISVFSGETLPQILMILLTAILASVGGLYVWPSIKDHTSWLLLLIAMGSLLISTLAAGHGGDARAAWNGFWHVLALVVFGLVIRQFTHESVIARGLLQLLIMCAVFQATYALHQYFVSMPEARAAYLQNPETELQKANINAPPGSELRQQYESRLLGSFEPTGTFALTNSLAVPLSAALLSLGVLLVPKLRGSTKDYVMLLLAISTALIAIAWLLTKSRTAYLATMLVAFAMLVTWSRVGAVGYMRARWKAVATGGAALALIGVVGLVALLASDSLVLSEAPKSIAFRLEYWQAATRMILTHPWTGVGMGNFQGYYPRYKVPQASEIIADPHNWLFDVAACCSVMTLVAALAALSKIAWRSLPQLFAESTNVQKDLHIDVASERSGALSDTLAVTVNWLWLGAALGFVATASLQTFVGQMLDLEATFLGLLTALASGWALGRREYTSRQLRLAACAAVVVILVCLLATGSWQASGIALPWLTWLAIAYPASETEISAQPAVKNVSLLVALSLLGGFYFTTWQPVHTSWTYEQAATTYWQEGDFNKAREFAQRSVSSDPISPSAHLLLTQVLLGEAQQSASAGRLDEFRTLVQELEAASDNLARVDQCSYLTWNARGENALALAAAVWNLDRSGSLEQIDRSRQHFDAASERYPSSVAIWAQRATVLCLLAKTANGKDAATDFAAQASAAARHAFELSQATPHTNRKLESQQVWLPEPLDSLLPAEVVIRPVPGSPWAKAEPLCTFIRSDSK